MVKTPSRTPMDKMKATRIRYCGRRCSSVPAACWSEIPPISTASSVDAMPKYATTTITPPTIGIGIGKRLTRNCQSWVIGDNTTANIPRRRNIWLSSSSESNDRAIAQYSPLVLAACPGCTLNAILPCLMANAMRMMSGTKLASMISVNCCSAPGGAE